jgi:hypothetical protein
MDTNRRNHKHMATTTTRPASAFERLTEKLGELIGRRYDHMTAKEIDDSHERLDAMLTRVRASRARTGETAR